MSESDRFDPERFEPEHEPDLGPEIPSAPRVEQPATTTPGTPGADTTVDPQLRVLFWKLVLLYKFSLLGLTLGILLVVFDTYATIGLQILAGSAVLFGYTLYRTKRGKQRIDRGEFETDEQRESHDDGGSDRETHGDTEKRETNGGGDTGGAP